ncbi:GatB/YqeY domain-containing protein [Lutimaribacter marinistellae]|uniref:GatB/YqeY domain-containing protein n=1 Tax=Lutimaribacter marinistellae TaxID=1820329 RepID=A0ABV7TP38_9RHOB
MTDLRMQISAALKQAMKDKDAERLSTLRLINAAIKDRDIANRAASDEEKPGCGNVEVLDILGKMAKQRRESARAYEEGGRLDLAEREEREIAVIQEFMPRQLDESEVDRAIEEAISSTGAGSIRDMGKVMGELKSRYSGRMDFGKVGPRVKDHLCAGQSPCA